MAKLSIKRIRRLIDKDKPKAIARYLRQFLPSDRRNPAEVRLDEYAHKLVGDKHAVKEDVLKKLEELSQNG